MKLGFLRVEPVLQQLHAALQHLQLPDVLLQQFQPVMKNPEFNRIPPLQEEQLYPRAPEIQATQIQQTLLPGVTIQGPMLIATVAEQAANDQLTIRHNHSVNTSTPRRHEQIKMQIPKAGQILLMCVAPNHIHHLNTTVRDRARNTLRQSTAVRNHQGIIRITIPGWQLQVIAILQMETITAHIPNLIVTDLLVRK